MATHRVDLTGDYRTTIYAAARRLLSEGADPLERIETWRKGKLSMAGAVGKSAKQAVGEPDKGGIHLRRCEPYPGRRVACSGALDGLAGSFMPATQERASVAATGGGPNDPGAPVLLLFLDVGDSMESDKLFAPFFSGPSWDTWRSVVKAAFAEPMDEAEIAAFRSVADRNPPGKRVRELVCVVGRGGGKDSVASLVAVHTAISFDPRGKLRPGERACIMLLACDRHQAGIVHAYIKAYFEAIPALKAMVIRMDDEAIELVNGVTVEIHTNSFRAVRGRTLLCVIMDEVAFWRDETPATPDVEVHGAVTPGLARMPGSMLILISSAHKRSGLFYQRHKDYYGKDDDDVLCVYGSTLQFNSTFDAGIIDRALEQDRERYAAEYLSESRDDLSSLFSRELLDAAVDTGVLVPPLQAGINYVAGCDPSGGRNDSFTFAVAHRERAEPRNVILDLLYERRSPFNPSEVVDEIVALMRQYHCGHVTGDKYGAAWTVEAFAVQSERDRSAVYMDSMPIFAFGRARLLDHQKTINQFAALERRTFSTGRDRIDPGPGHDDCANSVAIAMSLTDAKKAPLYISDAVLARSRISSQMRSNTGRYNIDPRATDMHALYGG